MISDSTTNYLYLSDKLKEKRYSKFLEGFEKLLKEEGVHFEYLEKTNDIWCRDFMPIQVNEKKYVQFKYEPYYLRKTEHLKTDPKKVIETLRFESEVIFSEIILDGGNVVKSENKVIITDQIVKENKGKDLKKELIPELRKLFEIEHIIIVPHLPYDWTGHADGIVRFIDNETVLINDYSKTTQSESWQKKFKKVLDDNKLNCFTIPYLEEVRKNDEGVTPATGCYMNFLEINNKIFLPKFNISEDSSAVKIFNESIEKKIIPVENCEIVAERGGILNCITWNIKTREKNNNVP